MQDLIEILGSDQLDSWYSLGWMEQSDYFDEQTDFDQMSMFFMMQI